MRGLEDCEDFRAYSGPGGIATFAGDNRREGLAAPDIEDNLAVDSSSTRFSTFPAISLRAEMRSPPPFCASITEDALTMAMQQRPGTSPSSCTLVLVTTVVISMPGETSKLDLDN